MKRLLILLCATVAVAMPQKAWSADECVIIPEEIIPLRLPNFDLPILWKRNIGVDGPDRAVDLISLADGGFVIVGDSSVYDREKGLQPRELYLARFDVNGKNIWEKHIAIKGFIRASAGVAVKDRLAIISEVQTGDNIKGAQIDYFDGLGVLKTSKTFTDPNFDLIPEAVVSEPKTQSLMIAFWSVGRKDPNNNFTVIKKITADGAETMRREYLPGVPNHLYSLKRLKNGDYIGTGIVKQNGVNAGWILRISAQGDLVFQRPYLRGAQSTLRKITEDSSGDLIAVGDSIPLEERGSRAAWIYKINAQGETIWQRFIKGKYAFSGTDVNVLPDERITAMINAQPQEGLGGGRDHVRALSFTPAGRMIGDEALIEGVNARGVNLLSRSNSRIISGMSQSGLVEYAGVPDPKAAGYDFWVMALPKLGSYTDPCAASKAKDSFDNDF